MVELRPTSGTPDGVTHECQVESGAWSYPEGIRPSTDGTLLSGLGDGIIDNEQFFHSPTPLTRKAAIANIQIQRGCGLFASRQSRGACKGARGVARFMAIARKDPRQAVETLTFGAVPATVLTTFRSSCAVKGF
jgi:hypothetical protein